MSVRRTHPRNWQDRIKADFRPVYDQPLEYPPVGLSRKPSTNPTSRQEFEPDCSILVSKRRGFGSTGNHESDPTSLDGINLLTRNLPKKIFMRYKVNIHLKGV